MSARMDRWLTRIYHAVGGALFLLAAGFVSFTAGNWHWPYRVVSNKVVTPIVQPGGTFTQTRVIDYFDDCSLYYDRRLQSLNPEGKRHILPPIAFERPPMDRSGLPQTIDSHIPSDFPCGPAMIVDTPTAECTWFQRVFWRQRRPDAMTPFQVACPKP